MFGLILFSALLWTDVNAQNAYRVAEKFVTECTPRDSGTIRSRLAANHILDAASSRGADAKIDTFRAATPRGKRYFNNVEAKWKNNSTGEWVVVVSHYDSKAGVSAQFANDGGSTTALLIELSGVLSRARREKFNVMLIWLDGEECYEAYTKDDGLWGSRRAAKRLKESGLDICAVICLDMLGDRDLEITIPRNCSKELKEVAVKAAKNLGYSQKVREIQELVKDDHVPFLEEGFKAIDLIDFEFGSAKGQNDYWHTKEDSIDKISASSLKVSGDIVCEMINILEKLKE